MRSDIQRKVGVLLLGALFVALGFWMYMDSNGFPGEVIHTGTLTVYEADRRVSRYVVDLRMTDGQHLTIDHVYHGRDRIGTAGDDVAVAYPPRHPEKARVLGSWGWIMYVTLGLGMLGFLNGLTSLLRVIGQRFSQDAAR